MNALLAQDVCKLSAFCVRGRKIEYVTGAAGFQTVVDKEFTRRLLNGAYPENVGIVEYVKYCIVLERNYARI